MPEVASGGQTFDLAVQGIQFFESLFWPTGGKQMIGGIHGALHLKWFSVETADTRPQDKENPAFHKNFLTTASRMRGEYSPFECNKAFIRSSTTEASCL